MAPWGDPRGFFRARALRYALRCVCEKPCNYREIGKKPLRYALRYALRCGALRCIAVR